MCPCDPQSEQEFYKKIFLPEFQESASRGCEGCTFLLQVVSACLPSSDLNNATSTASERGNCFTWEPNRTLNYIRDDAGDITYEHYELYVTPDTFNPFPRIIKITSHASGNTESASSVLQVQKWLRHCSLTHPTCGDVDHSTPLPTRLIDVKDGLRLVETKRMHGRYLCLSHCWGNQATAKKTFKTTQKNLSASLENIDLALLPRTFVDAITFTRNLDMKYLWIDSLCIIQDDEDDWRHEASLMADVYANALMTLGATASASDEEGLFRSSSAIYNPIEVHGKTPKEEEYTVYVRHQRPHYLHDAPLFKRGWILQERYLSTRFLHFASDELFWQCKESVDCECDTRGRLASGSDYGSSVIKPDNSPEHIRFSWRYVVWDYTKLALSYGRDKLPALSGIVKKHLGLRPGDRYVAGLLELTFAQDLFWSTGWEEEDPVARPEKWRAPTWSWASVDSTAMMQDFSGLTSYIEVLAINCTPVGDDITGELSSGYAILRGAIMAGFFRFKSDNSQPHFFSKEDCIHTFSPDYKFDVDDESRVEDGDGIFCLRIAMRFPRDQGWFDDLFLVLRRKLGSTTLFERIGLMTMQAKGNSFFRLFESQQEEWSVTVI